MGVIITIVASILVFGIIIFVHELGHFIAAKKSGIKVNEFAIGMGPKLFSKKKGDTTYSLRAFPIGGFVAMEGEDEDSDSPGAFNNAAVWKRIIVVAAGAIMNLLLGYIVILILTIAPTESNLLGSRTIAAFAENAASHASGLEVNDSIVAINGRKVYLITDIQYELIKLKDGRADMTVIRDGERVELKNIQFDMTEYENGMRGIVFDMQFYGVQKTFGNVITYSFRWTCSIARQIFLSVVDLITGNIAVNQLSGPVGIISVISDAAKVGFLSVLTLLAFISINLGIFNILPLPALDGGRLVFLVFEAITKKKLNSKYEALVNGIGFALLILLMVFVTYNDISSLVTR